MRRLYPEATPGHWPTATQTRGSKCASLRTRRWHPTGVGVSERYQAVWSCECVRAYEDVIVNVDGFGIAEIRQAEASVRVDGACGRAPHQEQPAPPPLERPPPKLRPPLEYPPPLPPEDSCLLLRASAAAAICFLTRVTSSSRARALLRAAASDSRNISSASCGEMPKLSWSVWKSSQAGDAEQPDCRWKLADQLQTALWLPRCSSSRAYCVSVMPQRGTLP
mmetsp:Transcript_84412/g.261149  ORF Transcript_84412/g.261149 Transcript_84412/m.261149 type:complete len:222 (-) Transcript_84412:574-1239(-)